MSAQPKFVVVSPLLTLMTAVDCHPIESVRQSAMRAVEASVGESIVEKSRRAIEKLLRPFADDPLEPLVLTATDLWMIAVIQADASKGRKSNPTIRIVGRDTLGSSGGVRLHGTKRAEQLRRTDREGKEATHKDAAIFFNELCEWEVRASVAPISHVVKHDTKQGFQLSVETSALRIPEAVDAMTRSFALVESTACNVSMTRRIRVEQWILGGFQRESHIAPSGVLLSRLGLRIERRPADLVLCSGSPESVMRITAALTTPGVLVLQSTRIFGVMLLGKGEDDVTCFRCHDGIEPDWTTAILTSDTVIDDRLKYDIARWCGPHSSWATPEFLENILTNFADSHS